MNSIRANIENENLNIHLASNNDTVFQTETNQISGFSIGDASVVTPEFSVAANGEVFDSPTATADLNNTVEFKNNGESGGVSGPGMS